MTVYVVALIDISDREEYQAYADGFMEIFNKYAGQVLAVDEAPRVIEGQWPHTRSVLISFPTADDLDRWYGSAEYQRLAQHRFKASTGSVAMLNGFS